MRCTDAILSGFLSHPRYQNREDFIQRGLRFVLEDKLSSVAAENWAFARYLPTDWARHALTQCLPDMIRKQQSTGLWKRKFAEKISYGILQALKHAQMLPDLVARGVLRYDPYKPFSESSDLYGLLVRRNIIGTMLPDDPSLQRQLVSQITAMQREDGSWGGTVARTALQIEALLDLGVHADEACIAKGAAWMLSQFRESVERWRPNASWGVSYRNVFTSEDCGAEFRSALDEMPEEDPKGGCFRGLPFIQTALALRVLVRLGFEEDKRVLSAYESLLDIRQSGGGWCATGCRRILEERVKAERRLRRKRSA